MKALDAVMGVRVSDEAAYNLLEVSFGRRSPMPRVNGVVNT